MRSGTGRTAVVLLIVVSLVAAMVIGYYSGYVFVEHQETRLGHLKEVLAKRDQSPIDAKTKDAVEIYIPREATTSDIAAILHAKRLIGSPFAFSLLSKFNGYDGNYRSGTHYLTPHLSYDEMMMMLTYQPKPVRITFREGLTYREVKLRLREAGIRFNETILDAMVKRPSYFSDYSFIAGIPVTPEREWPLQGYLWPDTYEFDVNASEEQILRTFLSNTERVLSHNHYAERAEKQGLTLDQAITLASIVQTEGPVSEMAKIGRVFLNRLAKKMSLQSCATINYLRKEAGEAPVLWIKNDDLVRFQNNPYNTYRDGSLLPPGPIDSPGTSAIEGVLWPATERTWPHALSYLYFVARGDGTNDFSITYEEHARKAEAYHKAATVPRGGGAAPTAAPTR